MSFVGRKNGLNQYTGMKLLNEWVFYSKAKCNFFILLGLVLYSNLLCVIVARNGTASIFLSVMVVYVKRNFLRCTCHL